MMYISWNVQEHANTFYILYLSVIIMIIVSFIIIIIITADTLPYH